MRLHLAQRRSRGKLAGGCEVQIWRCQPQDWPGRARCGSRGSARARPGGSGERRLLLRGCSQLPAAVLPLLWQGKARIDGNTSSFIWIAGNPRLPERKGSDTFPLPHISPFSSTENLAVWISTFIYKANDNAEQNYGSNQWLKYYLPKQIIYHCSLPLFFLWWKLLSCKCLLTITFKGTESRFVSPRVVWASLGTCPIFYTGIERHSTVFFKIFCSIKDIQFWTLFRGNFYLLK